MDGTKQLRDRQMEQALTLRLPSDLHHQLRAFAEAEDRSISGILRAAARQYLSERLEKHEAA